MTLDDKIEANANLTLWCVHVLGPDDVLAAPTHAAAAAYADKTNRALHEAQAAGWSAGTDILCFAYAAPWPYGPHDHAKAVKDWLK